MTASYAGGEFCRQPFKGYRGIWMMLGVVACMLGAFAYFFIYLMRRAKLAEQQQERTA